MKKRPEVDGILIKKQFGQHFLKDQNVLDSIVESVTLNSKSNVFEIGGGSGVLTKTILKEDISKLWVFEIDPEWVRYLNKEIKDPRLTVWDKNFLDLDFSILEPEAPWTVIANLPYNVTFPILHLFVQNRSLLSEGVIMIQEEVAEKLLKKGGRDYGFVSLYFQYYFDWKKLFKVPPEAFLPPPKVDSRVLYFKPKKELVEIPNENGFWNFIKVCFRQPRRTLGNNLKGYHINFDFLGEDVLNLRAQQMSFDDFLNIWHKV